MGFVLSEFTLLINIYNVLFMSSIRSKHTFKLCPYFLHISLSFCANCMLFDFFVYVLMSLHLSVLLAHFLFYWYFGLIYMHHLCLW